MSMNNRAFHWCFTLNNYTDLEYEHIKETLSSQCKYWIIGKEVGDSGTPHLQGYGSFRRRRYLRDVRHLCGSRIHFEVARGSARQNRDYCSKDGNFEEGGNIPSHASSSSSSVSRDEVAREFGTAIRAGNDGLHQFTSDHAGVWYFSGHNLLRNALTLIRPESRPNINVRWIYGAPGVGKSRFAHEEYPDAFIKDPRTKWWSGYLLEKEVIIDDFGPNGIDMNHLLRWFDRYKCTVETKGGMMPLLAESFIVTSNFEPSDCFRDKEGVPHPQMDALYRRIELIKMD